ncbi:MAG: PDZ domain-containing protein [bacterium]|nr:PDZ domain-containing protein [bacterium]
MKMNNSNGLMMGIVLLTAVLLSGFCLTADSRTDILPLGPSKYKFLIDKIEKDGIIDTASGKKVTLEEIANQNKDADVFVIGEAHDNYDCHIFQRDFIETLFKKYPKLIVGFEFFWREDNELLEQWRNGNIGEEELLKKMGWYKRSGANYGLTRLIMDMIKKNKIKTIGLNIPRKIVRTISREGFDKITEEERKLFPMIDVPNPQHEYFIKGIFGTMAAQMPEWFVKMYDAQKAWDVAMAESMRQMLAKKEYKGYKGVIIAGNNHVAFRLGIPFRYRTADREAKLVTISPVLLPVEVKKSKKEDGAHPLPHGMSGSNGQVSLFSRGIADYVFAASQPLNSHFPVVGVWITEKDDKLKVIRVSPGSIAEKNGLKKGDHITALDGVTVTTLEQFRTLMTGKNWDDSVSFTVLKKIELKKE